MQDANRIDSNKARKLLKQKLHNRMDASGDYATSIEGVTLYRRDVPNNIETCFYRPLIVLVAQGSKQTQVGTEIYAYKEGDVMVTGVDLPVASTITQASSEKPYLSVTLDVDKELLAQLTVELARNTVPANSTISGLFIQKAGADILDAFLRLVELLDRPERISILGPMIKKEIHYLLLIGACGHNLRSFHSLGSKSNQIVQAAAWLKENLAQPVLVEELAEQANMAPSTFHRYFREITSLSPLQYQKRLRLHEAQRLMLVENLDAGSASVSVGYESLSQFSREYKRLFGDPPHRNVTNLRQQLENAQT